MNQKLIQAIHIYILLIIFSGFMVHVLSLPVLLSIAKRDTKPAYHLIVKANAVLIQNEENISVNKIEKELAQKVKSEIVKTINKSDEIQADLLNISEKPYRYKHRKWDIHTINSFDKDLIKHIQVKINIEENVNYKR